MRKFIFFSVIICTALIGMASYAVAHAFFSDSATSTSNVFATGTFPTATPTITPTPTVTPTITPTPTPGVAQTLVVNELLWNSSCGQNDNARAANYWIELYNGSASQIDLKDWRFRDANGATIQISNAVKLLNSGQYMIITKDGSVFSGNTPCYTLQGSPQTANLGGNSDFLPATTGGVIRLEQPDGNGGFITVDRVEYGPTLNGGVLNSTIDHSIGRHPNALDSALGDTFAVSDFQNETTISPGVSNP